jgi:indole-3-glycerol phosphate synthase
MSGPEESGNETEHLPNSKNIRTVPEAQAFSAWTAPEGTLGRLTRESFARAERIEAETLHGQHASIGVPTLSDTLRGQKVAVIAEVKRRSPSKGDINPGMDAAEQARRYTSGGASAISVLTEPGSFGGSNADLAIVRSATSLPMLKKDFHVTESQLNEAKQLGASAALLIVRALDPRRIIDLTEHARDIGLEVVLEVRDENELEVALRAGAQIIGVNNRNLETLIIDPTTVSRILPLIPSELIAIAESGYSTREQVQKAAEAGADAVLVGSSISASSDPVALVRELASVERTGRSC